MPPTNSTKITRVKKPAISKRNFAEHLITSPFRDATTLREGAIGINIHRLEKGKRFVVPVFLDQKQRKQFHRQIIEEKGKTTNPNRQKVLDFLEKHSLPNAAKFRFRRATNDTKARKVVIPIHGTFGSLRVSDGNNNSIQAEETANILARKGLKGTDRLYMNSCFSGTEHKITEQGWQAGPQSLGDPEKCFGGKLAQVLSEKRGLKKIGVIAYPGLVSKESMEIEGQGKHMAVVLEQKPFRKSEMQLLFTK